MTLNVNINHLCDVSFQKFSVHNAIPFDHKNVKHDEKYFMSKRSLF